ncbi:MAG: hypothetical protein LBR11_06020 [Deltaproteobacteria bacterium]|jgi:hypothetical protein|nr:hypothetical protein [Deltaproteobacteria bacterium]
MKLSASMIYPQMLSLKDLFWSPSQVSQLTRRARWPGPRVAPPPTVALILTQEKSLRNNLSRKSAILISAMEKKKYPNDGLDLKKFKNTEIKYF